MNKFSGNSAKRRDTLQPVVKLIVNRALELCYELHGLDFGIPALGAFRTEDEQYKLFKDGKSQCDGFISESYHQTGFAVDTFAYYDKKAQWDIESLEKISCAMRIATKEIAGEVLIYEWGGNFKSFVDGPHHQWKINKALIVNNL